MHTLIRLLATLMLVAVLAACAQFGQSGISHPDLPNYEDSLSE